MNKKRLWTRGAAWLLTLCLLAGLCVPTVRADEETEPSTVETTEDTVPAVDENPGDAQVGNSVALGTRTADGLGTIENYGDGLSVTYFFENTDSSHQGEFSKDTAASDSFTVTGKSSRYWDWGYRYPAVKIKVTLRNTSENPGLLKLNWEKSGSGTVYISKPIPDEGLLLQSGDAISFDITSSSDSDGHNTGVTLKVSGIEFTAQYGE